MHIFSIILLTIVSITLIVVVLMQPSKTNGLSGFMGGGSETFYSKIELELLNQYYQGLP